MPNLSKISLCPGILLGFIVKIRGGKLFGPAGHIPYFWDKGRQHYFYLPIKLGNLSNELSAYSVYAAPLNLIMMLTDLYFNS